MLIEFFYDMLVFDGIALVHIFLNRRVYLFSMHMYDLLIWTVYVLNV